MNNNLIYETYIYISSKKLIISVNTNLNNKVYQEELLLTDSEKNIKFDKLDFFLNTNIFKIEKKIKNFVEKTNIILDLDIFFPIEISVKKNNYQANVNLKTAEGAYGGFRYATWGTHSSYLGGNPSGESLLMLAARPDNAQYPNRREVLTMLIEEFDAERNYRNGNEKTARDLNPLLMDEVHPLKRWTVEDAHAWAESAGLKVKIEHTYDWLKIFDAYQLDGRGLVDIWTKQKFEDYVDERLADLTRVGVNTDAIEEETPRWIYCLEQLKLDAKNAQKTKRRREAAARAEAERRQAIRDEQRRAKLRGKLDKGAAHVLKHAKSLGAFGSMGSLAAAKREAAEKKRREEEEAKRASVAKANEEAQSRAKASTAAGAGLVDDDENEKLDPREVKKMNGKQLENLYLIF